MSGIAQQHRRNAVALTRKTFVSMYACTRCFTVSEGTRTKDDSTAPADAEARCVTAEGAPLASSLVLHHSYAVKYSIAVGIVPRMAPVSPRYISAGPCIS